MHTALAEKQKLLSAGKSGSVYALEAEWAKYKYLILAKNPNGYKQIRQLLKDKSSYPAAEFFLIVDASLKMPENTGYEVNAAQHVFGYFKKFASPEEKKSILGLIEQYKNGSTPLPGLKRALYGLAVKYDVGYLLESYYFCDMHPFL
jgi:UV DNA damage endonuclease